MKKNHTLYLRSLFVLFFLVLNIHHNNASNLYESDTTSVRKFKGQVLDSKSNKPLVFATINVTDTNISTITNTQGEFSLKIPKSVNASSLTVSFLGYTSIVINLSDFTNKKNIIKLETYIEELDEVDIVVKDAKALVREVLKRKGDNYSNDLLSMTAFYRETIQKRRTYVSLSEAVLKIDKQPYSNVRKDIVKLHKARKSTDYTKLDTVTFKLKGGPFNNLFIDVMKNTDMFLTDDMTEIYDFKFEQSTKIDNRPIYVVSFKQKSFIEDPYFYGKLYIDPQTFALVNAKFNLNVENRKKASEFFIVKKPKKAFVYPTEASYQIDYMSKNGKWYYNYSRIELDFKINWDKKLFNTTYSSIIEMAVTDWEKNSTNELIKPKDRLRPSIILNDEATGFSEPDFWGQYNVIEPEKSIENAIKKIKKQLRKIES